MHTLNKLATLAASMIALAGCAPPAPKAVDTAADERTLRAGTTAWMEAYNAGDVDRIVVLYAEDGVMMPPHAPSASGHAAMREFLAKETAGSRSAGVTLADGVSHTGVSGDLGWHSGSYKVTDASGATVDSGSYMEVWRKKDGKWLIIRDIWNSDRPAAPPAAEAEAEAAPPTPAS